MNLNEMHKYLADKSNEEVRNFILGELKTICDDAINKFTEIEEYEKCAELLKIKNRVK